VKVEGSRRFAAPRPRVYEYFANHQVLARCLPGCEKLEPEGPDSYAAVMRVGIAAVKGTYSGRVEVAEREPPERYRLKVEASGTAGFVNMDGVLAFVADGDATEVRYDFDVQVGGPVAAVGQRVLGGIARLLVGQFFQAMEREVAA